MEKKTKTSDKKRRRSGKRNPRPYRSRTGTSCGQPVHIGFYINSVLDESGRTDRKKIIDLFNLESYG